MIVKRKSVANLTRKDLQEAVVQWMEETHDYEIISHGQLTGFYFDENGVTIEWEEVQNLDEL